MSLTKDNIIKRFHEKHGNRYDYSLVNYISSVDKLTIICREHGQFEQVFASHVRGRGCHECAKQHHHTQITMLENFKKVHGDTFDYSKTVFKGVRKYITITCRIHGDFEQRVYAHFQGNGCKHCTDVSHRLNMDSVLDSFKSVHSDSYDYSLVDYKNARTKVSIICQKHGVFKQLPRDHVAGKGCPSCKSSKGERRIRDILDRQKVEYEEQFKICKNPSTDFFLRVDFYIPSMNSVIEFDGYQHFKAVAHFGGDEALQKNQVRDKIKNDFCAENNIDMLRISYLEINDVEDIVSSFLTKNPK